MKKLLPTLTIITLATLPTLANANAVAKAGKAIGGGAGFALNFAVDQLLNGIGWVMDEGTRTEKIPDPTSGSGSSSGTGGNTATSTSTGGATGTGSTPSDAQTYPFEYWFDGQKFSSAESACSYAFSGYLSKKGLKKSRRQDGTYLEKTNIYIGSSGYFHHSVPGYFTCNTHAAGVNDSSCGQSNVCGSSYSWSGSMLYAGTEKTTTTTVSDDYAERREKARQAVEKAILDAQAQVNAQSGTGATTAPSDTTDRPKTGTTTGTGVGDLANPVHVDTGTGVGTGTTTGDTTTTNTNTTTNTTTTTNTNTTTNIKTEVKPLEMPTFCTWAKVVCDFITDDVDTTPKPPTTPKPMNLDNEFKMYINFGGSCPADKPISFKLMNKTLNYSFPYNSFCDFFEKISLFLVGFTYLGVATFILKSL